MIDDDMEIVAYYLLQNKKVSDVVYFCYVANEKRKISIYSIHLSNGSSIRNKTLL